MNNPFKKLFCKHYYEISSWRFSHGWNDSYPRYIEGFNVCKHCGKKIRFFVESNSPDEKYIIQNFGEFYDNRRRKENG